MERPWCTEGALPEFGFRGGKWGVAEFCVEGRSRGWDRKIWAGEEDVTSSDKCQSRSAAAEENLAEGRTHRTLEPWVVRGRKYATAGNRLQKGCEPGTIGVY